MGTARGRVGLLLGCVQRVFYPGVHRATVHALSAEGFEVVAPALPECCGALEFHSGAEDAAARRARETMDGVRPRLGLTTWSSTPQAAARR